jgi:hypothetical protein
LWSTGIRSLLRRSLLRRSLLRIHLLPDGIAGLLQLFD